MYAASTAHAALAKWRVAASWLQEHLHHAAAAAAAVEDGGAAVAKGGSKAAAEIAPVLSTQDAALSFDLP
jgi:hypothetical protein